MALYTWSSTAAANGTADATIGMAEGMAPSAVNDGVRALMAAVKNATNDWSGALLSSTSSVAYTVTTNQNFDTLGHLSGNRLKVRIHATNGTSPTLNVDGLGAKAIQVNSNTAVTAGFLQKDTIWDFTYDSSIPAFILGSVAGVVQAGTVTSTGLASNAVTYAKIQTESPNTLLGNPSSTTSASPSELTIGAGLTISGGTTLVSAFPPASSYKNLVIKVATTTTVSVTADFVTTTDGTTYQTTAVSSTINLGTTGADALDTGTIAIDSWYYIWVIAKADGTTKCLASTSSTSPTMPSGYTFKARVGAVQTIHGSATLYGTWQLGRDAQYVVGLAQTSVLPQIASTTLGDPATPTWTAIATTRFVPVTASAIRVSMYAANGQAILAPSSSYGAYNSTANLPPMSINTPNALSMPGEIILENSTNIYHANSTTGGCRVLAVGWRDNI